jgi:hypothetical protein
VSRRAPSAVEAGTLLRRVESLLNQAVEDLTGKDLSGKGRPALCSRCAGALAEASAELQSFAGLLKELPQEGNGLAFLEESERAALRRQIEALLPRLGVVQRLLAAAAEFYRGWCAVVPSSSYPVPGYQADDWSHRPALLALEG